MLSITCYRVYVKIFLIEHPSIVLNDVMDHEFICEKAAKKDITVMTENALDYKEQECYNFL